MKIVLIGFMCSGKSKVGRLLAKKLGWPHYDTDEMIAKQVGVSIADIIRKQGESAFREMERKTVALIGALDRCVISTGGGVPLDPQNMRELSHNGEIVWLKVSPETVLKRAGDFKSRPLIDAKDPLNSIRKRLDERAPAYRSAPHAIDTDHVNAEDIVERIFSEIPSLAA